MFAPLPRSLSRLETAVRGMDEIAVLPPPDITSIGERLRSRYAQARKTSYQGLPLSLLKKLPFAYWVEGQPPLSDTDPDLVSAYWSHHASAAVSSHPRRAKRWLSPLFYMYCVAFDDTDRGFLLFSTRIASLLDKASGPYAEKLKTMQSELSFFKPMDAPRLLASRFFVQRPGALDQSFQEILLWPGFGDTRLGMSVLESALKLPAATLSEAAAVSRLLIWAKRLAAPIQKSELRVRFADAVLGPWYRKPVPDSLKKLLVEFFVQTYGDPRLEGHRQYQWKDVSDQALATIMNWLAGDTLRGFMKLLQQTADQIWMYRQKFWMAYYREGYIEEAWLALGWDAYRLARRFKDEKGMGYGQLSSGAANNQSVLLLRIGNIVFTEWSHNGSLRAYHEGQANTPRLYVSSYDGNELRRPASLDFHDGQNQNPELRHMNSLGGHWQRKARDFISRHTGAYLNDKDIV